MVLTASLALSEAEVPRLAALLDADPLLAPLALDAVEEGPGRWRMTLFAGEAPSPEVARRLAAAVRAALGEQAQAPDFAPLPEADWVAKSLEGLTPVRAGRFLIHGSHHRDRRRPNDLAIEIEAGQAFGTGHHGTTIGCLRAIDRILAARPVRRALDIGTGSGVLAIAIARRARIPVLASDIDPVATAVAVGNVAANGVARYVAVAAAAGVRRRIFRERGPFDLIVANILAGPLVALAPAVRRLLAPGGAVVLSGLTSAQRARVVAAYRGQGLALGRSETIDDWTTLVLVRAPARRDPRPRQSGKRAPPARSSAPRL